MILLSSREGVFVLRVFVSGGFVSGGFVSGGFCLGVLSRGGGGVVFGGFVCTPKKTDSVNPIYYWVLSKRGDQLNGGVGRGRGKMGVGGGGVQNAKHFTDGESFYTIKLKMLQ